MATWPSLNIQESQVSSLAEHIIIETARDGGPVVAEMPTQEVQQYADSHNSKKFFSAIKSVYGSSRLGCPLCCLLTEYQSTRVLNEHNIRLSTKLKVHYTVVLDHLLPVWM